VTVLGWYATRRPITPILLGGPTLFLIGLAACASGAGGGTDEGSQAGITISAQGLTLPVGGQATLTAEVRDQDGAIDPGAEVSWTSLNGAVASVDGVGTVLGLTAGHARVTAKSGEVADTVAVLVVDGLTLEVLPADTSIDIGETVPYKVVARDGNGDEVAPPPLVWTSSDPSVAIIDDTGLATGLAPGETKISASSGPVYSDTATLRVVGAGDCDGIATVPSFDGSFNYDFGAFGTLESGVVIDATHSGRLLATLTRQDPGGPTFYIWKGDLGGNAAIDETSTDPVSGTTRLKGAGAIVPFPGGVGHPAMSLIVDISSCTYSLYVDPAIRVRTTQPDGSHTDSDQLIDQAQIGKGTPLGDWTFSGIAAGGLQVDGHSPVWAGTHLTLNAFSPFGFAIQLLEGSPTEPPVGEATISYQLTPQ
jgi:hypothetical protein